MTTEFGGFRIEEELGHGLATTVYRAVSTGGGVPVALKVFHLDFPAESSEERGWLERFHRDTASVRRLDHPSVVRLLAAGVQERDPWLALELVEGVTLAQALATTAMDLARKIEIAAEVASAIASAHDAGVLHLSLRPSNVFLLPSGQVKVSDFGELDVLATDAARVEPGTVSDQIHYRAPEQIYNRRVDARTDVFALGIVLYELIYHKRPFEGSSWFQITHRILNLPPPGLRESSMDAPIALLGVLDRALAKNPSDRYRTARELHRDLLACLVNLRRNQNTDPVTASHPSLSALTPPTPVKVQAEPGVSYLMVHDTPTPRVVSLDKDSISLGRRSDNDVVLIDDSVSRFHALIERSGAGWVLVDRRSRHGTFVNDRRISDPVTLREGDRIELGHARKARITFRSAGASDASRPRADRAQSAVPVNLLIDVAHALNSSLEVDAVLNVILDCALGFTGSERGFLLLRDDAGELQVRLGRQQGSRDLVPGSESVSTTLVSRCAETERPVFVRDANEDLEIDPHRSIFELKLKSILCLPLIARGRLRGVLYLDSRAMCPAFEPSHHTILQAFAEYAAAALQNASHYEMAIRDQRTGLYRHDYFEDRLKDEFAAAVRDGQPLSLVFADIDHFKAISDGHGHPAGNRVLKAIGDLLRSSARATDIAARWGGEEFVLLIPGVGPEAARITAERLRREAEKLEVATDGGPTLRVTVSFGVASHPAPGLTRPEDLVEAADRALYAAKQAGRNRVVLAATSPA